MKDKKKLIVIAVLVGMFLFGLCFVGEAGVCFDENGERNILAMNLLQYGDTFHLNVVSSYLRSRGVVPICESVERDHGIAPYYPFGVALKLFEQRPDILSTTWHIYTYLLFFLGAVYFYRLVNELFQSRKTALLGTAILFFTPRIFADGLYNNKDTVLLSLVIVMLFYGVRFVNRKDFKSAIFLGISAGFAGNMKISGIYVFALIGLFYVVELTIGKQWKRKTLLVGVTAAGTGFLCYLLLTPAIWGQGFQLMEFIKWNLSNATNFSRLDGTVLFEGTVYRHSVNPLPWYYLPKIMALTIPVYITGLMIYSVVCWCINIKKWNRIDQLYPLFLSVVMIPVAAAMISSPNIYNGWRHFYFLYGAMAVLAVYGVHYLRRFARFQKPIFGGVCLCLLVNITGIAATGIFSTGYVNFLGGGAEERYELDYYGASTKKILMELADEYDKLYIYSDSKGSVIVNYNVLPQRYRNKIVLAYAEEDLEKAGQENAVVFSFVNTSYDMDTNALEGKEAVREYKAWGNVIVRVYKKF